MLCYLPRIFYLFQQCNKTSESVITCPDCLLGSIILLKVCNIRREKVDKHNNFCYLYVIDKRGRNGPTYTMFRMLEQSTCKGGPCLGWKATEAAISLQELRPTHDKTRRR